MKKEFVKYLTERRCQADFLHDRAVVRGVRAAAATMSCKRARLPDVRSAITQPALSFYVRSELGIRFLDLTALRFLLDTPALTKHERSGTRR
jgi:hypothetical protein